MQVRCQREHGVQVHAVHAQAAAALVGGQVQVVRAPQGGQCVSRGEEHVVILLRHVRGLLHIPGTTTRLVGEDVVAHLGVLAIIEVGEVVEGVGLGGRVTLHQHAVEHDLRAPQVEHGKPPGLGAATRVQPVVVDPVPGRALRVAVFERRAVIVRCGAHVVVVDLALLHVCTADPRVEEHVLGREHIVMHVGHGVVQLHAHAELVAEGVVLDHQVLRTCATDAVEVEVHRCGAVHEGVVAQQHVIGVPGT